MRTYSQMKDAVREILTANNYGDDVMIYLGPDLRDYPGKYVVLTPYGGPGLEMDGALDARGWQVRCIGGQMDDEGTHAENMANVIDIAFISHYSRRVGGVWVSSIQRAGGAPSSLVAIDDGNRTHFVCSYIVSVELALPN